MLHINSKTLWLLIWPPTYFIYNLCKCMPSVLYGLGFPNCYIMHVLKMVCHIPNVGLYDLYVNHWTTYFFFLWDIAPIILGLGWWNFVYDYIWAGMSENVPSNMCTQWRFRSACALEWSESLGAFFAKDAKFLYTDNEDWLACASRHVFVMN